MRERLENEVRELSTAVARECIESIGPGIATREAERICRGAVRGLPDPETIADSVFEEKLRQKTVRRYILETVVEEGNIFFDRDSVTEIARTAARAAAEEETRRQLHQRFTASVSTHIKTAVDTSVGDLIRQRVAASIDETTFPRTVKVTVNDTLPFEIHEETHAVLPDLLVGLGSGCHVMLVGPAGTGKSTMAKQAARALALEFHALSVGPTTPTSKMFGYLDAGGTYHRTPLREAYEHGGLMLLDELDNGHPGLLAELNQALSLDVCAFPDGMIPRHPRFRMVATANTYGHGGERQYVGRQALDAATLDRFVVLDVPVDEALETRVARRHCPSALTELEKLLREVRGLRKKAAEKKLPVMFSPRASIHAARLLDAGVVPAKVRQWCLIRGMSAAHRSALEIKDAA